MAALSFHPWSRETPDSLTLKDVYKRVNLERGHFRGITEASLQEEMAGENALELSDSEDDNEEGDKEEERTSAKPATRDELFKAQAEMLKHLDAAQNDVMIALDFVSLTLTRYVEKKDEKDEKKDVMKGQSSMSPGLRQEVPLGTLDLDIWHNMPQDKARQAQDQLLATNVRMEGLQQSADGLLAAASRVEDNAHKETQYWDQVLSITENGWNVCKLPGEQHRLGVTYGFSESSPEFSRRGVAALNASPDGSIALERGVGSKPRAMRVVLKRDGAVVGSSRLPTLADDGETTLEARIRHARNSLFDEELYHEMLRESRSQFSIGVSMRDGGITFRHDLADSPHTAEALFELVALDGITSEPDEPREQDYMAQAIALTLKILLSQAHREKLKKRSTVPPPISERKEKRHDLPILRPVMAFLLHQAAVDQVNVYLSSILSLLSAAKVEHYGQLAVFTLTSSRHFDGAEDLISMLMQRWASGARLAIGRQQTTIRLETTLANTFGTVYTLTSPSGRATRFNSQEELRQAFDAGLASELAQHLGVIAGGDWKCNVRQALLAKVDGEDGKSGSIWVTVAGMAGVLSLRSSTKMVSWSGEGSSTDKGFQDAWLDVLG